MNKKRILVSLIGLLMLSVAISACAGAATTQPTQPSAATESAGTEAASTEAAATEPPASAETELNLYNWTTYMDPAIIAAFEKKYNVKVNEDFFGDNDELLAKIQPGNPGYDIIVPTDYMVDIMVAQNLLQELDHSKLANIGNVDDLFADPPYDPGLIHCVPYQWGTTALGYNRKAVGRDLDSWEVMFNHEFAGRISWLTDARGVMGITLIYLGYDPNTTNPDEINEAKQLLLDTKSDVQAFAPDTGQELLLAGEVDITYEYSGDIFQIMSENPDFAYVIPKEGAILWTDNMCIPVDAPHPDLAHKFIDFLLDPEVGAQLSNFTAYGTPNKASLPFISEDMRNNPGVYPSDEVKKHLYFIKSLGEADKLYDQAWIELGVGQ